MELHITIVHDVFTTWCLFHNLILGMKKIDVAKS
jgi:hypothetical protein